MVRRFPASGATSEAMILNYLALTLCTMHDVDRNFLDLAYWTPQGSRQVLDVSFAGLSIAQLWWTRSSPVPAIDERSWEH